MRYSLLAAASLIAVAFSIPAQAEDCGCRDQVRAALSRQSPMAKARPAPVRRAAPAAAVYAEAGYAEAGYDYRGARPVDMYPYRHRWEAAPQGYVPQAAAYAPPMDAYGEYAPPMPYGAPMAYGPQVPYGQSYGEGWAYDYRPAITIDQDGWFGGVGYPQGGGNDDGGGGGGGGGGVLTLAQPDSLNGPSYNNFGQSYGGAYGATNQINNWRAQAFAPKASK